MTKLVGLDEITRMADAGELSDQFQAPSTSAEPMKGRISREATVWCGNCTNWHQISLGKRPGNLKQAFRWEGWKTSGKYGWLCPDCQKENQ